MWNDKFILNQIPDILGEEKSNSNSYLESTTILLSNDPKKLKYIKPSSKSVSQLKIFDIESLVSKLQKLWKKSQISESQQKAFFDLIDTIDENKAKSYILKEIEDMEKGKSPVQIAYKSVQAREESLKSVIEMNEYLKNSTDWDKVKNVQLEAAELLHAHRMLTLNAIEGILKWRNQLAEIFNASSQKFIFKHEKENYLLKLRNDLDFIKDSEYAKVFYFGEGDPDPLLVYPSVPSGKLEKSRKRDPNYFINDGQVIVPLPSTITGRVREAEDAVKKEWDWVKFLRENDPKKLARDFAPPICEDYIDEVLNEYLRSIGDEIEDEKRALDKKSKEEKDKDELAQRIYYDLFNSLSGELGRIVQDEYLTEKALKESMLKQKKLEDERLAKLIYKSLKDELMESYLSIVVKDMIKQAKKEFAEEQSVYERGNIIEEMGLDFANVEAFGDLSGVMWVPIGLSEEFIEEALEEYYRFIPSINKDVVPDIESLMVEVTKNMDTRWYWAIRNNIIFALLIFSIDCYAKKGRKLIVHHISSLYYRALPAIIESATAHMWKIDLCDETRIALYVGRKKEITPEIKKTMSMTKYKWKAEYNIKNYDVTIFGRQRPNAHEEPAILPFQLKISCYLHSTDSKIMANSKKCNEMGHIGNRQIFLNSLLGLIGRIEKAEIKISPNAETTMQKETSHILTLMNQTQNFSFPNMKSCITTNSQEAEDFCRNEGRNEVSIIGNKISISFLDVNFRWISCTNAVENIRGENVKYMRLKSEDIICTKIEDTEVIKVPTELANISAFFIQNSSLKRELTETLDKELDLFCLTERLLMKGEKNDEHEVWVPCFNKVAKYNIPWIEGYELVPQMDEQNLSYIAMCNEETKLNINQSCVTEGLLVFGKKKGPVLMHDFIFGLMYTKGDKILDIPLFCCLVQNKDWIKIR
ncbi:hypothetical protein SteCoe_3615 [Stentor coeruleus]|uniref:Uncharacterized protein n=1 Tax=Stentor coeruleus TaxID=5963 RepID=A0A1R2CWJ1_9CILI|nr:hypothetical protein SteCoe_3615 [Stentor coeruleus]